MRCNDFNAKILFSCKKIQQGPIVDIITCYDKSDIPTCFPQNPQKITCLVDYYSNKYHSREKFSNVDYNIGKMKQYLHFPMQIFLGSLWKDYYIEIKWTELAKIQV